MTPLHTIHRNVIPNIPQGIVAQDVECSEYRVARPRPPKRSSPLGKNRTDWCHTNAPTLASRFTCPNNASKQTSGVC